MYYKLRVTSWFFDIPHKLRVPVLMGLDMQGSNYTVYIIYIDFPYLLVL